MNDKIRLLGLSRHEGAFGFLRLLIVGAVASLWGMAALGEGRTFYADCTKSDDSGDGLTAASAKRSVQAAVDLAGDGDTVILLPGVYDQGSVKSGATDATLDTRVMITNRITLTGRDGRDKTFIRGAHASAGDAYGNGTGAIRCITVGAGGTGAIVERITLCQGATLGDGQGAGGDDRRGGAFWVNSTVGNQAYLCDAVVSNCAAYQYGGGLVRGTAVCTRFFSNTCNKQEGGSVAQAADLSNCIIARNSRYYAIGLPATLVNCTVIDNGSTALYPIWDSVTSRHCYLYNCLMLGQGYDNGSSGQGSSSRAWIASNTVCQTSSTAGCYLNVLKDGTPIGTTDTLVTDADYEQCYGPGIGDYRLLPTSKAVGWGAPAHLARVTVPEKYRNRDCDGNVIDTTKATCQAGAIQTVGPTPATGKLIIDTEAASVSAGVIGFPTRDRFAKTAPQYVYGDSASVQVGVRTLYPATGFSYFHDSENSIRHYPNPETLTTYICLPPVGTTSRITSYGAAKTLYVDAAKSDDSGDGLSWAKAKKTIQAAVDLATDVSGATTLVLVKPGTYDQGGREVASLMTRVVLTNGEVYVRSTGSATNTFIVGGADTRCVYFSKYGAVQGFTITGGRAVNTQTAGESGQGAGLLASKQDWRYAATDCIISNNTGWVGSATYYCSLYRCRATANNYSTGGAIKCANLSSTVVTRNEYLGYMIQSGCKLYNCTLDSYALNSQFASTDNSFYNCLLGNGYKFQPYSSSHAFFGNVLAGNSTYSTTRGDGNGVVTDYSYTNLNFTLASRKLLDARPCRDVSLDGLGDDLTRADAWMHVECDLDGRPQRILNGKVMPGAAQTYAEAVYITNVLGKISVTGGVGTLGLVTIANGQKVTVVATEAATRPFLGFRVDGVLRDRSQTSIVLDASDDGKTIEAVYGTDWYVDAENGSDAADGMTSATARKTLEKIMAVNLRAGDTVHAAPGVYDEGWMTNGTSFYHKGDGVCDLKSRVVVPAKVRLVADQGPEKTFIIGAAATDATRTLGLGPGAMRCVQLLDGAVVSGFTLTGGHTLDVGDVPTCTSNYDDDLEGAGVHAVHCYNSIVENCTISNNAAYRGGAAVFCTIRRSRIFACDAANQGAATFVNQFDGTYIDHFKTDARIIDYYLGFVNSTVGADICSADGTPKAGIYSANSSSSKTYNSVILCPTGAEKDCVAFNSVFLKTAAYRSTWHTNCQTVATADGFFDADGAAIPGSGCPALGLADVSRYPFDTLGWTDVFGRPRFSNNAMDAGAVQSDWCARYATVLGRRSIVCEAASTNVHETASGVRLETGSIELCAMRPSEAIGRTVEIAATIDGTGALTLLVDGACVRTLTAADSPVSLSIPLTTGSERLTFAYASGADDTGSATIQSCRIRRGLAIIVR